MHFSNKIPMNIRITHIDIYTEQEIIRDGSLMLSDGVIASVCRTSEETADATRVINGTGLSVVPGYIDAHCHGGGGYDCNQGIEEAVVKMRAFYGRHGVTTLYPTLAADLLRLLWRVRRHRARPPGCDLVAARSPRGRFPPPPGAGIR